MQSLQRRVDAALGRIPCDTLLIGVRYLDVFSCEWKTGDLALIDGVIIGIEPGLKAKRTVDAKGLSVVPGFIDAHVHIESSLLIPTQFEKAVLGKGTTTAICDPHELANVLGVEGIRYFLDAADVLDLDLRVMLSSCVPATDFETNGAGHLKAEQLLPLLSRQKALGLAEVMNVPGVLNNDPEMHEKLEGFAHVPIDGHCPLLSGLALSAYASTGVSSCHESSRLPEAKEKLSKGISIWIREGSVAKDLRELAPLLTLATSTSVGFCTDDRNPLDIATEGHIDHLVRAAIKLGVPVEVAYRAASWSVARHYGLKRTGAIAPGYAADLVLLNDANTCAIHSVYKGGVLSQEIETKTPLKISTKNTIRAKTPELADLEGPKGSVHVIKAKHGSLLTERMVSAHDAPGIARLSVLERYGKGSKPANGYVHGFGASFTGAIASSVGHDSHNLIVVGKETSDMRVALASLIECGGGFCVVQNGKVLAKLELPLGGLMSSLEPQAIAEALKALRAATKAVGCALPEPFLQLAFLSLPVIPSLKLTDKGLVDVDSFKIIDVRAS